MPRLKLTPEERKARKNERECARYAASPEKPKAAAVAWRAANPERQKDYNAAWYAANTEKAKASHAAWRAANPEKVKAQSAARYAANPEKANAASAAWRAANPEKAKAAKAVWRAANHDKTAAEAARRRARKQKALCTCCKPKDFAVVFHAARLRKCEVDHCLPLWIGGKHCLKNLQILTPKEHREKSAAESWMRGFARIKPASGRASTGPGPTFSAAVRFGEVALPAWLAVLNADDESAPPLALAA